MLNETAQSEFDAECQEVKRWYAAERRMKKKRIKLTAKLMIAPGPNGQPLPYLVVQIDGDEYVLLDGRAIEGYEFGNCVEHRAECEIDV